MLLKTLRKFSTKKTKAVETEAADYLKTVGVRNEADRYHRQRRLEQMRLRASSKTYEVLKELYDTWVIDELPGSTPVYFARPFWDDYPELTRPSFDSREEALAHILKITGRTLER